MASSFRTSGDQYVGTWVEDRMEGQGKYVYKNGTVYEGSFHNNVIEEREPQQAPTVTSTRADTRTRRWTAKAHLLGPMAVLTLVRGLMALFTALE